MTLFEMAIDEMAYAAKLDPLEFRLLNYADTDQMNGTPFTSKALREAYCAGRRSLRLEPPVIGTALDARRQGADRLGHGDRHVGCDVRQALGARQAVRERPSGGRDRDLGHRHRHLHGDGAGRRRHAGAAARADHRPSWAIRACRRRPSRAARGRRPRRAPRCSSPAEAVGQTAAEGGGQDRRQSARPREHGGCDLRRRPHQR